MVILKKKILKDVRMKQTKENKNKIQDHDNSRVCIRKHVDEKRTDEKHLQRTKMEQGDCEIIY